MDILNRGFLTVRPKQAFLDWAHQIDKEVFFDESDSIESNTYLIEDDFFEIEPVIEKHFKKIFKHELSVITEDEELWPETRTQEIFHAWFQIEFGSIVVDLEKTDLISEKI